MLLLNRPPSKMEEERIVTPKDLDVLSPPFGIFRSFRRCDVFLFTRYPCVVRFSPEKICLFSCCFLPVREPEGEFLFSLMFSFPFDVEDEVKRKETEYVRVGCMASFFRVGSVNVPLETLQERMKGLLGNIGERVRGKYMVGPPLREVSFFLDMYSIGADLFGKEDFVPGVFRFGKKAKPLFILLGGSYGGEGPFLSYPRDVVLSSDGCAFLLGKDGTFLPKSEIETFIGIIYEHIPNEGEHHEWLRETALRIWKKGKTPKVRYLKTKYPVPRKEVLLEMSRGETEWNVFVFRSPAGNASCILRRVKASYSIHFFTHKNTVLMCSFSNDMNSAVRGVKEFIGEILRRRVKISEEVAKLISDALNGFLSSLRIEEGRAVQFFIEIFDGKVGVKGEGEVPLRKMPFIFL